MEVIHKKCAGLDVHKEMIAASVRVAVGRKVRREVRTFGATTSELMALSDWLTEHEVTHVAMEATGVYWKPVWHVLEGSFDLVLANAMHIRNVPGRKTDVNDAAWISDLLAHGLIRASFVPPTTIQELRALTRTRKQLSREVTQHTQRIQKVLEDANLKVAGIVSDILGVSGRAMIEAIIAGESDPEKLAALADGRLRAPREQLVEALRGRIQPHHRTLLQLHLELVDAVERAIARIEGQVEVLLKSQEAIIEHLSTTPGVSTTVAQIVIAEVGTDMTRFPTPGNLISWAGMCPGMNESAGKKKSSRLRQGSPWLRTALVQAAWAATRKKDSYLRAQYYRLRARRGPNKAIIAVAASILKAMYFILRDGAEYKDLGFDYFDRLDKNKVKKRLVQRLEDLGFSVQLGPVN